MSAPPAAAPLDITTVVRRSTRARRVTRALAPFLGVALVASHVLASAIAVNPTRITLSPGTPTQLLALRNTGTTPVRFQLSVYAWDQTPDGDTALTPTRDIILFPPLLTVEPGGERKVRIGTTTGWGAREKTYRVIVDELPARVEPGANVPVGLSVLTRLSIPIFVRPSVARARATLTDLGVGGRRVRFRLENEGTVHFLVTRVEVRGRDASGATVFTERPSGWYVLAATHREFSVPIPRDGCERVATLEADVHIGESVLTERLQVPTPSCATGDEG